MPRSTGSRIEDIRKGAILFLRTLLEGEGPYEWHPTVETSKIIITGNKPDAQTLEHAKPFLSVDVGGFRWIQRGLGHLVQREPTDEGDVLGDIARADVRITVGSKAPGQVSDLGYFLMWAFPVYGSAFEKLSTVRLMGHAQLTDETRVGGFSRDGGVDWVARIFVQPCLAWETFRTKPSPTDPFATTIDQITANLLEKAES